MSKLGAFFKKREVIALLLVPLAMTLFVTLVLVVPGLFAKPNQNFVYEYCPDYCYSSQYKVEDGTVVLKDRSEFGYYDDDESELYVHDVNSDVSSKLELSEASALRLDDSDTSSDGFKLQRGEDSGGLFIPLIFYGGGSDWDKWYLIRDNVKREVNIKSNRYGDVTLIGWVTNE